MQLATPSSGSASAFSGLSIVDSSITERKGVVILNNSLAAAHSVAGLEAGQQPGDVVTVINRGTKDLTLAANDTAAAAKDRFATAIYLPAGGKVQLFYNTSYQWEPFTDAPAPLVTKAILFTENATNTLHEGSVIVPAGAFLHDIEVIAKALWGAGSASMEVGDAADPDGYFTGVNLKATDLLVGEVLRLSDNGAWGGKEGPYVTSVGRRGPTTSNFGTYLEAGATIKGSIAVGTPGSTQGRTLMRVSYSVPVIGAATASTP